MTKQDDTKMTQKVTEKEELLRYCCASKKNDAKYYPHPKVNIATCFYPKGK